MTRRRRRRWILLTVALLLPVLAVAIVWLEVHMPLRMELRAWHAAGGVDNPRELIGPPPSDDVNAAVLYARAFDGWSISAEDIEILRNPWEADDLDALLARHASRLPLIHQAAALDVCYWPTEYELGIDALMPHIGSGRRACQLLVVDAIVAARSGDPERAISAIETGLSVAGQFGEEPVLISLIVQLSVEQTLLDCLERLFRDRPLPESDLPGLLSQRDHRASVRVKILADGSGMLATYQRLSVSKLKMAAADDLIPSFVLYFTLPTDMAMLLRYTREAVDHLAQPYHLQPALMAFRPPRWAILTRTFVIRPERTNHIVATTEARIAQALAAMELRSIREHTGSYPDTYDAAIDPFTGQPMEYERTEHGFVLRSAGTTWDDKPIQWQWN
ncbi:MAG: hypothetical protein KAS72_06980 [Phycisphaerales bacterium]|nr:hypothetical protein [Phycisphaerales bacterium]